MDDSALVIRKTRSSSFQFKILISEIACAILEYNSPVDESFKKMVPRSAPIVDVVIFAKVSSASSNFLVFARSVVTQKHIRKPNRSLRLAFRIILIFFHFVFKF